MSTLMTLERFVGAPMHVHADGALVFYEASYSSGQIIPCHVHGEAVISLVLDGAGVDDGGNQMRPLGKQDILFTPSHAPHGYRFATNGRWFNIQIADSWLERVTDGERHLPTSAEILKGNTAAVWAARVRSEVQLRDRVSSMAIDGAMMLMLAELARTPDAGAATRPRWLRRVEEAIDGSFAAPPPMEQLAALAGVHPRHLLRTFRRYHGTTIAQYVRQRQLQQARAALATSKQPLAMIALDAGFSDQAHFTRVFRHTYGETPGEYARAARRP
jgi:AraC family transcriptional regulator